MSESEFAEYLDNALLAASDEDGNIIGTSSFESVGMLTNNEGLVVRMIDGSEFQVTVVRSR